MSESNLWKSLKRHAEPFCHIIRIENSVEIGTPDVNGCYKKVDFWIELKYVKKWPKLLKINHFTEKQKEWLVERGVNGGNSYLLVQVGRDYLLFNWTEAVLVHTYDRDASFKNAFWHSKTLKGVLNAIQNKAKRKTGNRI